MSTPVVRNTRRMEADEDGYTVIFNGVEIKCFRPPVENGFRRVAFNREWNLFEHRVLLFTKNVENRGDMPHGH